MATNDKVKVAVVGASGYSGIEAVRILSSHPFVELGVLTSEHYAGREVADVYRHMAGIDLPPFEELRPDLIQGRAEVAISCLPETVGTAHTAELIKAGVKVVDLSADYRFKNAAQFRTTYGIEHPAPHLLNHAAQIVFSHRGLPFSQYPQPGQHGRCQHCRRVDAMQHWTGTQPISAGSTGASRPCQASRYQSWRA